MIRHLIFAAAPLCAAVLLATSAVADPSSSGLVGATHPHNHHRVVAKKTSADVAKDKAAKDADAPAAKTPPKISNKALAILPP